MRKFLIASSLLGATGAVIFWLLTMPQTIAADDLPDYDGDPARGRYVFDASGCASCHAAPGAKGNNELKLSGGLGLKTPFGTFVVPNITPHAQGIGDWPAEDIAIALKTGLLPDFDTFGGTMIPVQENMAQLTAEDRAAIAAYLKSLAPKPSRWVE